MSHDQLTILFISSTFKGSPMIHAMKDAGCRTILLAEQSLENEPWPHDAIDEIVFTPDLARYQDVINTVTWMNRGMKIDHILPLDEFEVELVSILREHLLLNGRGVTKTRNFRDKLRMRHFAKQAGIAVPEFTRIANYDELREYMSSVDTPWMLKPRMEAGAMGIQKMHDSESVWRALDELGDRQSYYLLEEFLPGDVFHVDSLVVNGKIEFVAYSEYASPPIDIYQGGGVFATRTLKKSTSDAKKLKKMNEAILKTLGMDNGATHAEFIKANKDGEFYFLEVAARVGGAFVSDMVEHGTGINLWREWANLELAMLRGEKYKLPKTKSNAAGLVLTLSHQEHPDTTIYSDAEIVWHVNKPYHAGMIFAANDHTRVAELVQTYKQKLLQDFSDSAPPMDAFRTGYTG